MQIRDTELKQSLKPKYLRHWTRTVLETTDVPISIASEYSKAQLSRKLSTRRLRQLGGSKAKSRETPLQPAVLNDFFALDDAIRDCIADDSPLSGYRNNPEALLYRTLTDAFPSLIDWLATTDERSLAGFNSLCRGLLKKPVKGEKRGMFGRMVLQTDRGAVAYWLATSSPPSRALFQRVFSAIANAHNESVLALASGTWVDGLFDHARTEAKEVSNALFESKNDKEDMHVRKRMGGEGDTRWTLEC